MPVDFNDRIPSGVQINYFKTGVSGKFSPGNAISAALQLFKKYPEVFLALTLVFLLIRVLWYFSHPIVRIALYPILNVVFITGSLILIRDLDTTGQVKVQRFFSSFYSLIWTFSVWVIIWVLIGILPVGILLSTIIPYIELYKMQADVSPGFPIQSLSLFILGNIFFVFYFFIFGLAPYFALTIQLFNPNLSILKSIKYSFNLIFYNIKAIIKISILATLLLVSGFLVFGIGYFLSSIVLLAFVYYIYKTGIKDATGNIKNRKTDLQTIDHDFT